MWGPIMGDSDYEEPCVLTTVLADGVASAFVENGMLRITYFESQRAPGSPRTQKVAVIRVAIALAAVLESRAVITEALKLAVTPERSEALRYIGDLLMN